MPPQLQCVRLPGLVERCTVVCLRTSQTWSPSETTFRWVGGVRSCWCQEGGVGGVFDGLHAYTDELAKPRDNGDM